MDEKLKSAFQNLRYEVGNDLAEASWHKIVLKEERNSKLKLWAFSLGGIFSFTSLIPTIKILLQDFSSSGFYEYTSLLFSDGGSILKNYKEFAFSIAESLPLESIILSLTLLFIFFLSIRFTSKQIIRNQLSF